TLRIFGHDPQTSLDLTRRRIGVVAHEPYLYEGLTVAENLRLFCSLYGGIRDDWDAMMRESGLAPRAGQLVRHLSRGWVQRAAVARALLPRPDLLVLDEPFTGLDAAGAAWLRGRMAHHLGRGGSIVVTTHRVDELDGLQIRVARLHNGALHAQ
ncbi:MAG: ABC transporter ATP-binding protein, partial [Armatimonadetes bacterium]|nr:ABC transporter ATP-binding protein [Armatimonadota bacterium]